MPVNSRMTAFAGSGIKPVHATAAKVTYNCVCCGMQIFSCEWQEDSSFDKVTTTWDSSASYTLPTDVPGGTLVHTLAGRRALPPL